MHQHWRVLLLQLQSTLGPRLQQEKVRNGNSSRLVSSPSLNCIYLDTIWIILNTVCSGFFAQMWMSVRTQKTVKMAAAWTPRAPITASALHPGPWPLTATVVWLLRSRLVSADSLQWERPVISVIYYVSVLCKTKYFCAWLRWITSVSHFRLVTAAALHHAHIKSHSLLTSYINIHSESLWGVIFMLHSPIFVYYICREWWSWSLGAKLIYSAAAVINVSFQTYNTVQNSWLTPLFFRRPSRSDLEQ